jgi:DNA invertase Pin-like site-specific DNA recombinase
VIKCFAYLRVSSIGQTQGDGYDRQFIACETYAKSNGYEIVEVFRESMTGKSELEDRPALSSLFAALEENGIKTILIAQVDRLARDLMVQETIIADMQKHGYTLISVAEPDLCSTDPSRILVRQIFGAIAQYDRAMITLKLRGARQRMKLREGRCEGRKPFGSKPGEAEAIHQMRSLKAAGLSCDKIADALNANGVPARGTKKKTGPWLGCTIARILKREATSCETT